MTQGQNIDGVLLQWGDRLFYPGNRIVHTRPQPKLSALAARQRAAAIRERIEATVVRRAPQVMVKVTGGGRGMRAIAAHFRYISKNGRLDIEDDRGDTSRGKPALQGLADDWRYGGTFIDDLGDRREAYNIMLSMPRGTDPLAVQRAAREFAKVELADHKYVMVLHDHQANPHVHISVRAESRHGKRLCREAARSGRRSRGDPPGHPRARQELRHPVAAEGPAGWAPADDAPGVQGHGRGAGDASAGRRSLDARGQGAGDVWRRGRPEPREVHRCVCEGHAIEARCRAAEASA